MGILKFYHFACDYPHKAIVWARDAEDAADVYEEQICSLTDADRALPPDIIDIHTAWRIIKDAGVSEKDFLQMIERKEATAILV